MGRVAGPSVDELPWSGEQASAKRDYTRGTFNHTDLSSTSDFIPRPKYRTVQPTDLGMAWAAWGTVAAIVLDRPCRRVVWRPWQHPQSDTTAISSSNVPSTSTPTGTTTAAAPPPAPTSAAPEPPRPTSTVATPSVTVTTPASNPNGPGCSSQRPDKCGPWTPEQAAFACRAIAGGADYTAGDSKTY